MTDSKTSANGSYQIITPPNTLKDKVGPGKGIDPKVLERAQALVDGMSGDFEERAYEEAGQILRLADIAEAEKGDERVADIFRIGHELKGQGGTFGYPLISRIGGLLCRYIESVSDGDRVDFEIVRAHANALRAIAGNKTTGEGGPLERQLIDELEKLLKHTLG